MTPTGAKPTRASQLTPTRRDQYLALLHQIATLPHGTPCTRHDAGLDWLDPEPDRQNEAAARCDGCPALQACAEYLRTDRRLPGVWAGVTEHERQGRAARNRARRTRHQAQHAGKAGQ